MKNADKVLQIAEEIAFVKVLSHNDQSLRNRAIKKLKRWIKARSSNPNTAFTDDDFVRLWQGLFFSMWMSDKPLIQEECAERISDLIHSFATEDSGLSFIRCFYHMITEKWSTIDTFRLDKFAMLVRRFTRQSLVFCKNNGWNGKLAEELTLFINRPVLPQGLFYHMCDILIEEICKVADKEIGDEILIQFLRPFFKKLAATKDRPLASYMKESVIKHFFDLTDVADEYREKFRIWKQSGFKGGRISVIQKVDDEGSDEEGEEDEMYGGDGDVDNEDESALDPRPGGVDVVLPVISVNADKYIEVLEEIKQEINKKTTNLTQLFVKFYSLKRGDYPYGIKRVRKGTSLKHDIEDAVERMVKANLGETNSDDENEDEEIEEEEETRSKKQLKRKRKEKLQSVNFDDLGDIVLGKKGKWSITDTKQNDVTKNVEVPTKNRISEDWNITAPKIENTSDKQQKNAKQKSNKSKPNTSDTKHQWKILPITSEENGDLKSRQNLNLLKDSGQCWWKVLPTGKENGKVEENETMTCSIQKKTKKDKKSKLKEKNNENSNNISEEMNHSHVKYNGVPITSVTTIPEKLKHIPTPKQNAVVYPSMKGKDDLIEESKSLKTPSKPKHARLSELKTPTTGRRLSIRLDMNTSQDVEEHLAQLISNPELPFDARKKPIQGVLKPSPMPSPVNPFYGKRKNMRSSFTSDEDISPKVLKFLNSS